MFEAPHDSTGGRLIRRKDVLGQLGVSETTLWRMEKRGDFPRPVKITPRLVGYREAEIVAWLYDRPEVA
jgi:prophage regulatory protein